jgi:hypothetical protein
MQADTTMDSEKDFDQHLYDLRREIMVSQTNSTFNAICFPCRNELNNSAPLKSH